MLDIGRGWWMEDAIDRSRCQRSACSDCWPTLGESRSKSLGRQLNGHPKKGIPTSLSPEGEDACTTIVGEDYPRSDGSQ